MYQYVYPKNGLVAKAECTFFLRVGEVVDMSACAEKQNILGSMTVTHAHPIHGLSVGGQETIKSESHRPLYSNYITSIGTILTQLPSNR